MKGICRICGCTEDSACTHPDFGECFWVDDNENLCSHCMELPGDPKVKRAYGEYTKLVNMVQFQLDNIKGYLSYGNKESALIKSDCLIKAAKELEESLKKQQ